MVFEFEKLIDELRIALLERLRCENQIVDQVVRLTVKFGHVLVLVHQKTWADGSRRRSTSMFWSRAQKKH
jgi:hypothetical protein